MGGVAAEVFDLIVHQLYEFVDIAVRDSIRDEISGVGAGGEQHYRHKVPELEVHAFEFVEAAVGIRQRINELLGHAHLALVGIHNVLRSYDEGDELRKTCREPFIVGVVGIAHCVSVQIDQQYRGRGCLHIVIVRRRGYHE